MKKQLLLSICIFSFFAAFAQQPQTYSRVKIYTGDDGLSRLAEAGVTVDHGECKKGFYFISDFSAAEVAIMKEMGFSYEVLIKDVSDFYVKQNAQAAKQGNQQEEVQAIGCYKSPTFPTPTNFALGTMGGFLKYTEFVSHIDTMVQKFPSLISAKAVAGTSVEGRPIYWMRISNNPNVKQNKPEILYNSLHHAREPASMMQQILYMYYLLENYNTNAEVKYLVDNCEMYFMPMVNPDGYVYNQNTNPNGGGMWRKNRKNNGNGTFGVDLNRNYGYQWGFDNTGSSNNSSSDTYRGTAGFSEPETQVVRNFCNNHKFRLTLNYHTYSDLLIYPWGYQANFYTPDSATFVNYAMLLTRDNHYNYGTANQTVQYTANGTSDDWMYGEQSSKPKIFAMTPEAGQTSDGFWPAQNRIVNICKVNLTQNLYAAHLILKYARATDEEPRYVSTKTGYFNYKLTRLGLDSPSTFTVNIVPLSGLITSVGSAKTYTNMSLLQTRNDSISFTLSNTITDGQSFSYIIEVGNGQFTSRDTITKMYGQPVTVFYSNAGSMVGWSTSNGWNTTTSSFYTAPSSITDSPGGNYASGATSRITTTASMSLTGALSANLTFWSKWIIEPGYDYLEAEVSTNGGSTWTPVCGKYTKPGNGNQDPNQPIYDGFQLNWVKESIDLDAYVGQNILLRFELNADNGSQYDGFYFDEYHLQKIMPNVSSVNELDKGVAQVSQNMPNPASRNTIINYTLPEGINDGSLVILNSMGQEVYREAVDRNKRAADINVASFAPGVYFYRLVTSAGASSTLKMTIVN